MLALFDPSTPPPDTAAGDVAEAVRRVIGFVECFRVELAVERCQAREYVHASLLPEGAEAETVSLQLDRLKSVLRWAVTVADEAAEAVGR